jgi:hypothetical protein
LLDAEHRGEEAAKEFIETIASWFDEDYRLLARSDIHAGRCPDQHKIKT